MVDYRVTLLTCRSISFPLYACR